MEQDTKSSDPKYFNIQMAAELSGLSAHTIRAWEKRYQALTPERAENGRRLYSNREVERLTVLSQLTRLGSSIGQIARLPDEELNEIYLNKTIINTSLVANGGTAISNNWYWTSSQQNGNANNAYYQFFGNGTQALNAKANMASVRAVRHWTDF